MKKKMKKFFMKGTDDVLEFGDMVELDLSEDMPNGHVIHHHLECKFIPDLIPLLLNNDIIEEKEVEEEEPDTEKNPLDPEEGCPMIDELLSLNNSLEERLCDLEGLVAEISAKVDNLVKKVTPILKVVNAK